MLTLGHVFQEDWAGAVLCGGVVGMLHGNAANELAWAA
jgi:hypothetical protein